MYRTASQSESPTLHDLHTDANGITTGRDEMPADAPAFFADVYAPQPAPTDAELEAEYEFIARLERIEQLEASLARLEAMKADAEAVFGPVPAA